MKDAEAMTKDAARRPRTLEHGGWDPMSPPPREAVERGLAWMREALKTEGKTVVMRLPD